MRKVFVVILLVFCGHLSAKDVVVNGPSYSVRTVDLFEIEKVTINDTATVLSMKAIADPKSWVRITKNIFIQVGLAKYPVLSAHNIIFGEQTYMDKTGEHSFSLFFQPIDKKTETFNYISEGYVIWDVDLKPKKKKKNPALSVPDEFIRAAQIKDDKKTLEAPAWKADSTMFSGYFSGYKPEMEYKVKIYVDDILTNNHKEYETAVNKDGTFALPVPMPISTQVLFRVTYHNDNRIRLNDYILLSPGERSEVCFHLPEYFRRNAKYRNDKDENAKYLYFAGANAELNNLNFDFNFPELTRNITDLGYKDPSIASMSAPEYKDYILRIRNEGLDKINRSKLLTGKAKTFFTLRLRYDAAEELHWAAYYIENAYKKAHGINYRDPAPGFTPPVLDSAYYSYYRELPVNDPVSLYFKSYESLVNSTVHIGRRRSFFVGENIKLLLDKNIVEDEDIETARHMMAITPVFWKAEQRTVYVTKAVELFQEILRSKNLNVANSQKVSAFIEKYAQQEVSSSSIGDIFLQLHETLSSLQQSGELSQVDYTSFYQQLPQVSLPDSVNQQAFMNKYGEIMTELSNEYDVKKQQRILDIETGLFYDLMKVQEFSKSFEENTPLSENSVKKLKSMEDPFYFQYLTVLNDKLIARIEENRTKKDFHIYDVAGKENDDLFEAIIGKEKCKVILIDFWATWCGPCRIANAQFSPVKSTFDTDKVTFLYLTDESSPLNTWQNMIPDLSGKHYRLNRAQYEYLKQRLNVSFNGIPSYLILDGNGEKSYFTTGFPGAVEMKNKINEVLNKN